MARVLALRECGAVSAEAVRDLTQTQGLHDARRALTSNPSTHVQPHGVTDVDHGQACLGKAVAHCEALKTPTVRVFNYPQQAVALGRRESTFTTRRGFAAVAGVPPHALSAAGAFRLLQTPVFGRSR